MLAIASIVGLLPLSANHWFLAFAADSAELIQLRHHRDLNQRLVAEFQNHHQSCREGRGVLARPTGE